MDPIPSPLVRRGIRTVWLGLAFGSLGMAVILFLPPAMLVREGAMIARPRVGVESTGLETPSPSVGSDGVEGAITRHEAADGTVITIGSRQTPGPVPGSTEEDGPPTSVADDDQRAWAYEISFENGIEKRRPLTEEESRNMTPYPYYTTPGPRELLADPAPGEPTRPSPPGGVPR